jgi:hypothetical protein
MNIDNVKTWLKANPRAAYAIGGFILALILCMFFSTCSHAQSIPRACGQYQRQISREVSARLGPNATPTPFAAQIMQESSCNAAARSSAGALGLTQFIPDTAYWIGNIDQTLAPAQPMNPLWAIRALVVYDSWLMQRDVGLTECDTYAFALSSYNGGEGWLHRDQRVARAAGYPADVWFGSVELNPDARRNRWAIAENRGYPRRILLDLQPRFVAANWGHAVACDVP